MSTYSFTYSVCNDFIETLREHETKLSRPTLRFPLGVFETLYGEHIVSAGPVLKMLRSPDDYDLTSENRQWLLDNKPRLLAELTAWKLRT